MKKFIIKVFMPIVVCLLCMQTALAADKWHYPLEEPDGKFGGGEGTESAPYLITSAQQLADLAYLVNDGKTYEGKYFKLTTDITLNDDQKFQYEWTPIGDIGTFINDFFSGYFDGGGHTVSGLYLTRGDQKSIGLFGCMSDAVVKNLTIKNCYMYGKFDGGNYGGFLAGYILRTQVVNCNVVNSSILASSPNGGSKVAYVGGLVGEASESGSITGCSFSGEIKTMYTIGNIYEGGIAGDSKKLTIKNCRTDGTLSISIERIRTMSSNRNITINGISNSAEKIMGCLNNISFEVIDAGTNDTDAIGLCLNTICYQADYITRSANLGKITVNGVEGYNGILGNVYTPNEIADCAFYTVVEGTFDSRSYGGKLTYLPLGKSGSKFTGQKRTVTLDESYFTTPNPNGLKRDDLYKDSEFAKRYAYETNAATLKDNDDIFDKLNSGSRTAVWGRIFDENSPFNRCPLPLDAGGEYDNKKLNGEGTEADPYLIGSEAELNFFAKGVSNGTIETRGKYFALSADIYQPGLNVSIGNNDANPFRGTFDGCGHVIGDIVLYDGALFGYVEGTVKNLGVINSWLGYTKNSRKGVIVDQLNDRGLLTDCYVGGNISVYFGSNAGKKYLGPLCAFAKGTISNCYFKGKIKVEEDDNSGSINIGGIAGDNSFSTINDSYASFTVEKEASFPVSIYGIKCENDLFAKVRNCYSVCDGAKSAETEYTDYALNGKRCDSDSEVLADYEYTATSAWMKGAYRPVLRNACHYEVTAADGSDDVVFLDAIPQRDDKNLTNDIFHYSTKDGDKDDRYLWEQPNLAIYDTKDKIEYILNCTLVPDKPLVYKAKESCKPKKVSMNMHYPLAIVKDGFNTEKQTAQHYYMLCLPGSVSRGDLPSGSRLLVCGKVQDGESCKTINAAEVTEVPGGVPFIMYLPNVEIGQTLDIVMRSEMAVEPKKSITVDGVERELGLQGTFIGGESAVGQYYVAEGADETILKPLTSTASTLMPFSANVADNSGYVKLVDFLMLDETSDETDRILKESCEYGSENKVLLKRALRVNAWNTLCLPFDMSEAEIAEVFGEGTKLERLSGVDVTDDGCTLRFNTKYPDIQAGVCYLIKPTKESEFPILSRRKIVDWVHGNQFDVTIDGMPAVVKFCGTYGRKMLGEGEEDEFFTQDNTIYHVADGQQIVMDGFRCYITASEKIVDEMSNARMVHGDGSTTNLTLVEVGSTADGQQRIYDLQGIERQATGTQPHGVYIKGGRKYVK